MFGYSDKQRLIYQVTAQSVESQGPGIHSRPPCNNQVWVNSIVPGYNR